VPKKDIQERRTHPRAGPFDGAWSGASGGSVVRISDLSEGGCFVESLIVPPLNDRVTVMLALGSADDTCVTGHVTTTEPGIGFGVQLVNSRRHSGGSSARQFSTCSQARAPSQRRSANASRTLTDKMRPRWLLSAWRCNLRRSEQHSPRTWSAPRSAWPRPSSWRVWPTTSCLGRGVRPPHHVCRGTAHTRFDPLPPHSRQDDRYNRSAVSQLIAVRPSGLVGQKTRNAIYASGSGRPGGVRCVPADRCAGDGTTRGRVRRS
jgi:hypothetical protein